MNSPAGIEPLYLLLGPETGKKNTFIGEVRAALAQNGEPPEEYRFYAFETSVHEVVSLLRNASLFASRKLVIYNGAEDIRKKDEFESLAGYAKNPARDGTLIFTSDGFQVDKKLADCVGARGTRKFWELFDSEKKGWVIHAFQSRKVKISPEAAELFLDLVENTTLELEKECAALCLFKGENTEVTPADIEAYLYHSRPETVFSLFETICALDLAMSLEILGKIFLEGKSRPPQLLAGLVWSFRNLLAYARLLAQGTSPAQAQSSLKITSKRNQHTYGEGVKNFSAGDLENILVLCADFDERLHSGGAEMHPRLVELFLYSVICRKGLNFLHDEESGI
jgi:DNA polymerase-3 subunit delta